MSILPLNISAKAIEEVKSILKHKQIPSDYALRIAIKGGGGCMGVNYIIGFDKPTESDDRFMLDGLEILIEKKHVMFLMNVELDYVSNGHEQGFTFNSKLPDIS